MDINEEITINHLKQTLDNIPSYVYIKNKDSKYLYANKLTLQLFNCSEEELIGRSDTDFFPSETASYLREVDLKVLNGLNNEQEIGVDNSDGSKTTYLEIKSLLNQSSVEPSLVEFEITETSIMQNIQSVVDILKKIKKLGVKISIDDFGTGYSSMSYLKKLPIDTLKIDREFIKELESDDDSRSIVSAIMALAKSLNLSTVAEGVENEEQKEILRESRCDMLQGYLYSKPLSLEDLVKFLD